MKTHIHVIVAVLLTTIALPAFSQRDATSSSARAAYGLPASSKSKASKKTSSRKQKKVKKRKSPSRDADRQRRRSLVAF